MADESTPKEKKSKAKKKSAQGRVVLQDLRGRIGVYNLPHEVYCEESGECCCTLVDRPVLAKTKDGKQSFRIERGVRQPLSITILPRGESQPLHPAALKCEQIRNAMRARPTILRVKRER